MYSWKSHLNGEEWWWYFTQLNASKWVSNEVLYYYQYHCYWYWYFIF